MELYGQEAEVRLLASLLPLLERQAVIDVGAERGSFVRAMLAAGSNCVHAIEPDPENAAALRDAFTRDPRITVHELAAGNRDEDLLLHTSVDALGTPISFGHTLLERPSTDEIGWSGTVAVSGRSLGSLVEEGALPAEVGIVKIDTEGNDFAVVEGMGSLDCDLVMVEHWHELPMSLGPCPWTTEEMAAALHVRGFSHFAFVVHRPPFTILKWDDGGIPRGAMGNLLFLHDRVLDRLLPTVTPFASSLAESALETGLGAVATAAERLAIIEELHTVAAERLALIEALEAERAMLAEVAQERLDVIEGHSPSSR